MNLVDAVKAARRAARDDGVAPRWTDAVWISELEARAETHSGILRYDPYSAAIAFLMDPNAVQQRGEGGLSETYTDLDTLLEWLRSESARIRAKWVVLIDPNAPINLRLTFEGY